MNAPEWIPGGTSKWDYFITQGFAWLHYTRLFFVRSGSRADTDLQPFEHWYDLRALAGFLRRIVLVGLIRYLARRDACGRRHSAWRGTPIALIPTSSIYPLAEVVNEHRVFCRTWGGARVVFILDVLLPRRAFAVVVITAVLALGAGTWTRNKAWADRGVALEGHDREESPKRPRSLQLRPDADDEGELRGREELLRTRRKVEPANPPLEISMGINEGALGNERPRSSTSSARWRSVMTSTAISTTRAGWSARPRTRGDRALDRGHANRSGARRAAHAADEVVRRCRKRRRTRSSRAASSFLRPERCLHSSARRRDCFRKGLPEIGDKQFLNAALLNREAVRYNPNAADAWTNLGWSSRPTWPRRRRRTRSAAPSNCSRAMSAR